MPMKCMPPPLGHWTDRCKSMGILLWEVYFTSLWRWAFTRPWKPFHQLPLTWRIFVASFTEIRPLSTEMSRHTKQVLTDGWARLMDNGQTY